MMNLDGKKRIAFASGNTFVQDHILTYRVFLRFLVFGDITARKLSRKCHLVFVYNRLITHTAIFAALATIKSIQQRGIDLQYIYLVIFFQHLKLTATIKR